MRPLIPTAVSLPLSPLAPSTPGAGGLDLRAPAVAPSPDTGRRIVRGAFGGMGLAARDAIAVRGTAWRGSATSVLVHALVLLALVHATARSAPRPVTAPPTTGLIYVRPPDPAVRIPVHQARAALTGRSLVIPVPRLIPPLDIPTSIPPVNLSLPPTPTPDFHQIGVGTGDPNGPIGGQTGGGASGDPTAPFFAYQVETPVVPLPGGATPRYPELLKAAGVEGEAMMQFVVDVTGRVEPGSVTTLRTTHALFALAIEHALAGMRFHPAEVAGHPVRQLVQQAFVFRLGGR